MVGALAGTMQIILVIPYKTIATNRSILLINQSDLLIDQSKLSDLLCHNLTATLADAVC